MMEPAALLDRLDHQLRVLTSRRRATCPTGSGRCGPRSTGATELLDPHQQRLLAVLGRWPGSSPSRPSPRRPVPSPTTPRSPTASSALVDNSLVRRLRWADGTRFRMLEPMREYAQERLAQPGEEREVRHRCWST